MDKLPTAEEFILSKLNPNRSGRLDIIEIDHAVELAIEFAKLCVERALLMACSGAKIVSDGTDEEDYISEESIINSYPLENIV